MYWINFRKEMKKLNNNKLKIMCIVILTYMLTLIPCEKVLAGNHNSYSNYGIEVKRFISPIKTPLNCKIEKYIYNKCKKNELSYSLVLAMIKTESNFYKNCKSNNDYGLMQVNVNTFNWINNDYFNGRLNINNPYDNIAAGIWYLKYVRNYWRNQGCSEETVFKLTIISYNRGVQGCKDFVEKYGYNNAYLNRVLDYKIEYEKEG